jgi:hypothetical protein
MLAVRRRLTAAVTASGDHLRSARCCLGVVVSRLSEFPRVWKLAGHFYVTQLESFGCDGRFAQFRTRKPNPAHAPVFPIGERARSREH